MVKLNSEQHHLAHAECIVRRLVPLEFAVDNQKNHQCEQRYDNQNKSFCVNKVTNQEQGEVRVGSRSADE